MRDAVSTDSHDRELLTALLAPLAGAIEQGMQGRTRALAVLHAGLVLVRFGTWLLAREGVADPELVSTMRDEETGARADTEAFVEMVITHDVGTPYPSVG